MESGEILSIGYQAVGVILKLSLPILLVGLLLGLIVALFQALTQIQEMTLAFVPKIIGVFVAILFLLPYMSRQLASLQERLISHIVNIQ